MFPRKERGSAPSDDNRGQSDLQVLWFQDFLVSAQNEEALFRKVNCKIVFLKDHVVFEWMQMDANTY